MSILDEIVGRKKDDLERVKRSVPFERLVERARRREPRDFEAAVVSGAISVIAEMKRASPSAGLIRERYEPAAIARSFEKAGARALSVLTEPNHFLGSLAHLEEARAAVSIPVLRKDFVVDDYQVVESAAAGADALLLIARIVDGPRLERLVELCYKWRLSPLVEIYGDEDIAKAVSSGARLIGINNRDLATMRIDISRTPALRRRLPRDRFIVSESGISSAEEIRVLASAGVNAFLIGEALMRSDDPGKELERLLGGA